MSIKNLKVDACYLLLQSVSLVFYSFSLFQWKMSNSFKSVSFVTLVSAVSGRLCLKKIS